MQPTTITPARQTTPPVTARSIVLPALHALPGVPTLARFDASPVPGPELPPVRPKHPALPNPVPSLARLAELAAAAPADQRFTPGDHPSTIHNAHYSNTRAQLAYALAGPYNSVEGDVRVRDGIPVMKHDPDAAYDLTFEQWALIASRAGKHLRIDLKEPAALAQVAATLERLGIPAGSVTFNVGLPTPWSAGVPIDAIRALRMRFPASWITLNLPVPLGPGYLLAVRAAQAIGGDHLGVAIMGGLVHRGDIAFLRSAFAVVNAWNLPLLGDPDVVAMTAKLRAIGVNGMVDLRRKDDPLAND
ncbi:MAG: Family with sequence similarity er [Thermoleophilia bacterium]|nr:Family with sequence similarity er [Thermoleophilia bacterium]